MENKMYFVLDIGSTLIKLVIFYYSKGNLLTLSSFITPTKGVQNGVISSQEELKSTLMELFANVKKQTDLEVNNVILALPSVDLQLFKNQSTSKISVNNTVSSQDIDSLNRSFAKSKLGANQEIIANYPIKYYIDNLEGYNKPPYGVKGNNIQLTSVVVTMPKNVAHSYVRLVESCQVGISHIVVNSSANIFSCLYEQEMEQGAFIIDMGGHSTTVTFVIQNVITGVFRVELGGEDLTYKIAEKLNLSYEVADELKVRYGSALINRQYNDPIYFDSVKEEYILENEVNESISQVLEELFAHVKEGLIGIIKKPEYPLIFTGGGSSLKQLADKASSYFNLNCRISNISLMGIRHNSFATACGALRDYLIFQGKDISLSRIIDSQKIEVIDKTQ